MVVHSFGRCSRYCQEARGPLAGIDGHGTLQGAGLNNEIHQPRYCDKQTELNDRKRLFLEALKLIVDVNPPNSPELILAFTFCTDEGETAPAPVMVRKRQTPRYVRPLFLHIWPKHSKSLCRATVVCEVDGRVITQRIIHRLFIRILRYYSPPAWTAWYSMPLGICRGKVKDVVAPGVVPSQESYLLEKSAEPQHP